MKHNPQAITSAMQLYFSGESLRNTMKSLKLLGVEVSHQTVYNWIRKYVQLMGQYVEKIVPDVSDTWRADELYVKIKGDMKYLFALMDDETRYWIAQEVAESKYKLRDREKTMRGLKKNDTPILVGYQLFHNYIRGHEGLEGKTPAEACGIRVQGKNKWLTLIQNASKES